MGRGAVQLGLLILLGTLAASSTIAAGDMAQLVVDEDGLYQGQTNVIHVAVDAPRAKQTVDVHVTIERMHGTGTVERAETVPAGDAQLVTVTWTPKRAGAYTLEARTYAQDALLDVDQRTVEVGTLPATADAGDSGLPATAPGTVQWAIAFGILFFVARAGLGRRG